MRHHSFAPLRRRFALLAAAAVAAVVLLPLPGHASKDAELDDAQKAAVQKVGEYFNKLTNLQGEFIQMGPRGHVSQGTFYLSKPGKLRFEYNPPNPFLIVSDGDYVIISNRRKNKAEYYPLSATPLRLVLDKNIDLFRDAKIIHVAEDEENLSVTLEDREQLVDGQLTVIFNPKKMELRQWVVIDGQGLQTTITLQGLKNDVEADPKLFEVRLRKEFGDSAR